MQLSHNRHFCQFPAKRSNGGRFAGPRFDLTAFCGARSLRLICAQKRFSRSTLFWYQHNVKRDAQPDELSPLKTPRGHLICQQTKKLPRFGKMPVCWQEERRRRGESPGSRRSWSLVRDPGSHEPHTKAGHRQTPMFSQGAEALSGTLTQSACETAITHSGVIRVLPGSPDARPAHQCGMRNQTELQQGSWSTYSMRGTTVEWKDLHW